MFVLSYPWFNDFAHIPWEDTPTKKDIPSQTVGEISWYLSGASWWDLRLIPMLIGGGNSIFFKISPRNLGERFPIWRSYFSDGLVQPPTSQSWISRMFITWTIGLPNRKVVLQPSIFRGELLVSGRVPKLIGEKSLLPGWICPNTPAKKSSVRSSYRSGLVGVWWGGGVWWLNMGIHAFLRQAIYGCFLK